MWVQIDFLPRPYSHTGNIQESFSCVVKVLGPGVGNAFELELFRII
jgi:hypothetical protein